MHKSDQKLKLSERDRRTLHRIVRKDRRTTALKITSEVNEHPQNQFSTKTVRRELHKKYSKEELQFKNFCFQRQMFQSVWSGVWPVGIRFLSSGNKCQIICQILLNI